MVTPLPPVITSSSAIISLGAPETSSQDSRSSLREHGDDSTQNAGGKEEHSSKDTSEKEHKERSKDKERSEKSDRHRDRLDFILLSSKIFYNQINNLYQTECTFYI